MRSKLIRHYKPFIVAQLDKGGKMQGQIIHLTEDQHNEVKRLKSEENLKEWEAVIKVLRLDSETPFITRAEGTASNPKPGLIVEFI